MSFGVLGLNIIRFLDSLKSMERSILDYFCDIWGEASVSFVTVGMKRPGKKKVGEGKE